MDMLVGHYSKWSSRLMRTLPLLLLASCGSPGLSMAPASHHTTNLFYADSYPSISAAGLAAQPTCGTVILERIYEVSSTVNLYSCVTYRGGGIRRACTPTATISAIDSNNCLTLSASLPAGPWLLTSDPSYDGNKGFVTINAVGCITVSSGPAGGALIGTPEVGDRLSLSFLLAKGYNNVASGVTIDGVEFDGNASCNGWTHDWRMNNGLSLRGRNTIKNSTFHDMPSENITSCGAIVSNNEAWDLSGSFLHKSCTTNDIDVIAGNTVIGVNLAGDAAMQHSEGAITLSNVAGSVVMVGNFFAQGSESVVGCAGSDDEKITVVGDVWDDFPHDICTRAPVDETSFRFDDVTKVNVGPALRL